MINCFCCYVIKSGRNTAKKVLLSVIWNLMLIEIHLSQIRISDSKREKVCAVCPYLLFQYPGSYVQWLVRFIIKMWRPSVNVCDEGKQICGRIHYGSFIRTICQPATHYLKSIIWWKTIIQWWNITVWLLFLPKTQVCSKKLGSSPRKQWQQKQWSSDTWLTSNTGHGQTNRCAWLKLCVMVEGRSHVNASRCLLYRCGQKLPHLVQPSVWQRNMGDMFLPPQYYGHKSYWIT